MKIGDEVYVHGYVDEIRKDCIIIRNDGGYFGTVRNEIIYIEGDEIIPHSEADNPQMDSEIPKNALRSACTGCRFVGTYDTQFPCKNCVRKNKDYYDSEYMEGSR